MIKIPAIDIKNGKCVRLTQGEYDKENIYFDSPVEVAKMWKEKGVEYIHLVDLDGALKGQRVNTNVIKEIASLLKVELGGGIRTLEDIKSALDLGVEKVIIGTSAVKDKELVKKACSLFGDRIIVSIDAKNGFVATDGWTKVLSIKATDFAKQMEQMGVKNIIYTDIATDGMLKGPNIKELNAIKQSVNVKITASGGISCLEDVKELERNGFYGAIIGKAIYEGKIKVEELLW